MRRLDELLTHATERGVRTGPDCIIEHLERRLDGERELVVAADRRGGAMVTTEERPAITEQPRPKWMRPIAALSAFAVVVVAVAATVFLNGRGSDEITESEAFEVVHTFAQNMRDGDIEAIAAMWTGPLGDERDFLEWNIGLGLKPEFTDCRVTSQTETQASVLCTVVEDPDSFYSRLLGPEDTTMSAVVTSDGTFQGTTWPASEGLVEAERELREWIRIAHPDLEDQMFGDDYAGILEISREAGELHMLYLDEYLAYLANPPLTPERLMERIAAAIETMDPATYSDLAIPAMTPDERDFLEWMLAMQAQPVFGQCQEEYAGTTTNLVDCSVKYGTDYFFSMVLGEDVESTVRVRANETGIARLPDWPPAAGVLSAVGDFGRWIQVAHPELEEEFMFEQNGFGYEGTTKESGELHMQYLDEYLAYQKANS